MSSYHGQECKDNIKQYHSKIFIPGYRVCLPIGSVFQAMKNTSHHQTETLFKSSALLSIYCVCMGWGCGGLCVGVGVSAKVHVWKPEHNFQEFALFFQGSSLGCQSCSQALLPTELSFLP